MIDRRILEALKRELNITYTSIYDRIKKVRESRGFTISREEAAALLASESGIDISKYLVQDQLSELRKLQTQQPVVIKKVESRKAAPQSRVIQLASGLQVKEPLLSNKIISESVEMSEIYQIIYIFENSVRNFISSVLAARYGENWWDTKIRPKIQDKVKGRMDKEDANRWHGRRGKAPIFYTDIYDLLSIIRDNWVDFEDLMSSQTWIESRISEVEISRNIIAHNNPLDKHDIRRIKVYFEDWVKLLKAVKDKI